MAIPVGAHRFGPENASLIVKTYREGMAAKVGHDLIIEVQRWDAVLEIAEDPSRSSLELNADAGSLHPRDGLRGIKPLTDRDRGEIRKNIDDKVLGGQPISFRSTAVEGAGGNGRLTVRGDLTMAGTARPATFELELGPGGELTAGTELVQSDWGIKPYRGLMGALKVRDSLEVRFEGELPAEGS
jgi:polyisoprenoid-binding protein YceI